MKKILLILAAIAGLLAIVYFSVGLLNPSVSYETRVEINKGLDESWGYFIDEKNMKDWLPKFKSMETLSGKPNEIGSRHRLTVVDNGEEYQLIETVTDFKAKELYAFNIENELLVNEAKVRFSEKDGKTVVIQEEKVTGVNLFWRSMFAFMKSTLSANSKAALEKLKQNIESKAN